MTPGKERSYRQESPALDEQYQLDLQHLGKEFLRLYQAALALGVPTILDTSKATIVITPKDAIDG